MKTLNSLLFAGEEYKPYFSFWLPGDSRFEYRQYTNTATGETAQVSFQLHRQIIERIDAFTGGREQGRFALLFAAFSFLLHRYSGNKEVIIHTPLYLPLLQGDVHEPLVPVRVNIRPGTLQTFLESCKQALTQHYRYQNFPLELLPLAGYNSNILLRYRGLHQFTDTTAGYGMIIDLRRQDTTLHCTINYDTAAFASWFIQHIQAHIQQFLSHLGNTAISLTDIDILGEAESRMLDAFNATSQPFPDITMHGCFEEQVLKTPEQAAVIYHEKVISYRELNDKANRLAQHLRHNCQIREGDIIAVCLPRSEWQVCCMLAILKTGAVYLPADAKLPGERIRFMLENAKATMAIVDAITWQLISNITRTLMLDEALIEQLAAGDAYNPVSRTTGYGPAYLIYTSGSTGVPKGVMIAHRSNVNMSLDQIRRFEINSSDRVLQFSSVSFDASISEYFMALYCGATIVVMEENILWDTTRFLQQCREKGVTVATLPPSYLGILDSRGMDFLRVLITAGEAAHPAQARFFSTLLRYYNAYGPTEYAVCASIYRMPADTAAGSRVPIGSPIANTELRVLDNNRRQMPIGVSGRLYVAGVGLALGYLGLDKLTAEKFVPHWRDPQLLMYDTGDLARWLPDGNLEFMGRSDDQLKIDGFRIEPGEIAHVMLQYPGIAESIVLPAKKGNGQMLAAFYRPATANMLPDEQLILEYLRSKLPVYMIPASLTPVAQFPVNNSGKTDKDKLLALLGSNRQQTAPENEKEAALKRLWETILGVENIGIHDNFFKLGGGSIDVIALYNNISVQHPHIDIRTIFKCPTVELYTKAIYPDKHR